MLSRPLSYLIKLPVLILIYVSANSALAQGYNSSISRATGGTGRAAVEAGDVYLNPATMAHVRGRFLASTFAENEWSVSLGDNTSESVIPGAFAYTNVKKDVLGSTFEESDFALTLAEFVAGKWAFGVTAHYREQKYLEKSYRQTNGDLGVLYNPIETIGLAMVVYDIFGENSKAPEALRRQTSVGAGFNYIFKEIARFRIDATTDSLYMVGVETYMTRFLISRIGFSSNTEDSRDLITAGLGFKGPRFGFNYAYEGNPKTSGDYRHSVDLVIPF